MRGPTRGRGRMTSMAYAASAVYGILEDDGAITGPYGTCATISRAVTSRRMLGSENGGIALEAIGSAIKVETRVT